MRAFRAFWTFNPPVLHCREPKECIVEPGSLNLLNGSTWLLPGPTNIGLYDSGDGVILIDSGNDKDAGRKILRLIESRGWKLRSIINTHSNADHIGANAYLHNATGCEIFAPEGEAPFIEFPALEGSFLWGGFPLRELRSKFFEAKPSSVTKAFTHNFELQGLKTFPLPGHFFDMCGVVTPDGVAFVADSIFGAGTLEKYKIPFMYDVGAFRDSLKKLACMEAAWYIPSHGEPSKDIRALVELNQRRVDEVENAIMNFFTGQGTFEDCLAALCDIFGILLDYGQYALVGSTIKSFISYLSDAGKLRCSFESGRMFWKISHDATAAAAQGGSI